ncbi:MAG: polyisoprenoid-binding protein [Polaromonas sp.]|nr:polyisoprenoid-binding protein [Polaromonas sp.]
MKKTLLAILAVSACAAALAQSGVYKVDPSHTKAIWEAKHFGTSTNRGQWDKTDGEITLDKVAKSGKVDVTIDMSSINTGIAPFNSHLKGPDFFDVATHPTARFVGEQLKFDGDKVVEVAGTMTIRGKANPAVLKATSYNCYENPRLKREVCGGDFETVIKRSAYDVNWGLAEKFTSDDIKVTIQVEAIKQ